MNLLLLVGILAVFLIGAWSICSGLFKWFKSLGKAEVVQPGVRSKNTAPAKARKIYCHGKLLNWDELPKYNGPTGWLGLAKFSGVVVPNKCYYPSICYMDTAFKQYFYDLAAFIKAHNQEGLWKVLASYLAFTGAAIFGGIFWFSLWMLLLTWYIFILTPSSYRDIRQSAELTKNVISPDEWVDIYVNAHADVELASRAKRMPSYRGAHHISSSGYSKY